MDEREGKAYYLGALVVGLAYLLVTVVFLFYIYLFGYTTLLIFSTIIIMASVDIFLIFAFLDAKKKFKRMNER